MRRVLHAEWTKLRTARATAWLPLLAGALTVALSAAVSAAAAPDTTSCAGGCDPVRLSLSGVYLGQTVVVALAVVAVTGEYRSGLINTTLMATPQRLTVFTAKVAAITAAVLLAGLAGVAGSLAAGAVLLRRNGFTAAGGGSVPVALTDGATLRAAAGTVLYLALVALLSAGLATALRGTAVTLTAMLSLLYLTPIAARFVADERWYARIERYSPMNAGLAVQATRDLGSQSVGPWAGLGVLAAYAAIGLALGALTFTTRDT